MLGVLSRWWTRQESCAHLEPILMPSEFNFHHFIYCWEDKLTARWKPQQSLDWNVHTDVAVPLYDYNVSYVARTSLLHCFLPARGKRRKLRKWLVAWDDVKTKIIAVQSNVVAIKMFSSGKKAPFYFSVWTSKLQNCEVKYIQNYFCM